MIHIIVFGHVDTISIPEYEVFRTIKKRVKALKCIFA